MVYKSFLYEIVRGIKNMSYYVVLLCVFFHSVRMFLLLEIDLLSMITHNLMGSLNIRELFHFRRKLMGEKANKLKLIRFSIKLSKLQFTFNSSNYDENFSGEIKETCWYKNNNYIFLSYVNYRGKWVI